MPLRLNSGVNLGMTNVSRKIVTADGQHQHHGRIRHRRAHLAAGFQFLAQIAGDAFEHRRPAEPVASLALTSETYVLSNSFGCRASAAEKSSPPSTAAFSSRRMRVSVGFCSCSSMPSSAAESEMPVSTMTANWLVA